MNDDSSSAALGIPSLAEALAGKSVISRSSPSLFGKPRGRVHVLSNQPPPRAPLEERLEAVADEPLPAACIPGDTVPFGTRMPPIPEDAAPPPAPPTKTTRETNMPKKKGEDAFDERQLVLDAVQKAKGPASSGQISKAVGLSTFKINKVLAALEVDSQVSKTGTGAATRWHAGKVAPAAEAKPPKTKRKASGSKTSKRAAASRTPVQPSGDPPTFTVDDAGAISIFQGGESMKLNLVATRRLALFIDRTKSFRT